MNDANTAKRVAVSDKIKALVAARIAARVWRAEAQREAVAASGARYGTPLRAAVEAYVAAAYEAAGAGYAGRWQ